ncbi:maintenance of mitochondrial structure and function-domain-containing protein [Radiomyces spectabilis]|uniref:maintenance of mitochondrial structure and function-domain-containing protein n=1 Tax=Radiomyces spectabilis TaxID=64574 RepID=UPI00222064EA|nr:maintenance of mitochondrial structure and function-domain-containing protein [Radiomyces spectabilis]KAI8387992.1 maintenance of mitochondrial structure and function-domain-containing protein [Radiomyces spectabilis]
MSAKLDTLHVSVGNSATAPHQRPFTISINPVVLFSVLDHYLRRDEDHSKVVGALLGVRSLDGTEVEIRNSFSMIYNEEEADIALDKEHYKNMYELHQRVNPEEVILGWYTAGGDLTPAATPIHTIFSQDATPFRPIHVTFDTEKLFKSDDLGFRAYTCAPVGFTTKPGDCMFLPVPCEIKYRDAERSGLDMLASAKSSENRTAFLLSDMDHLEIAVVKLQAMLERISQYVDSVVDGTEKPNNAIGRYIMDTVSVVPKMDPSAFEKMFNSHLQDLLMVVYLANMTRTQLSVTERLNLLVSN